MMIDEPFSQKKKVGENLIYHGIPVGSFIIFRLELIKFLTFCVDNGLNHTFASKVYVIFTFFK